jgi:hypothetical protein
LFRIILLPIVTFAVFWAAIAASYATVIVSPDANGATAPGSGLWGDYYKPSGGFSVSQQPSDFTSANAAIAGMTPTSTFTALSVCFPSCFGNISDSGNTLSGFLGSSATNMVNGSAGLGDDVAILTGYIQIGSSGVHSFTVHVDDDVTLKLAGTTVFTQFGGGTVNDSVDFTSAGLYSFNAEFLEGGGGTNLTIELDGSALSSSFLSNDGPPTAAPEPCSIAVLGSALGLLAAQRRRAAVR